MKLLMQNWNEQLERTNFDIHDNFDIHRQRFCSVSSCVSKFVRSNCSFQFCMRSFIVALLINLVSGIALTQRCPADLLRFDVSIGAFKFDHRTLFLF